MGRGRGGGGEDGDLAVMFSRALSMGPAGANAASSAAAALAAQVAAQRRAVDEAAARLDSFTRTVATLSRTMADGGQKVGLAVQYGCTVDEASVCSVVCGLFG